MGHPSQAQCSDVRLTIESPKGDDTWHQEDVCTLGAFLNGNQGDLDTCERVIALNAGESVLLGGGACPVVRVTREL